MSLLFILNSVLLGVGLAMDAFSVSIANGLNESGMSRGKMCGIAGTFGFFQFAMPVIGWVCVHTVVACFSSFQKFVPWIALILLLYIGGKMILENIRGSKEGEEGSACGLGFGILMIQGIATSIDALSVGFTIAEYNFCLALIACSVIAVVTFVISLAGVVIGKKAGGRFTGRAEILGGIILIGIGIEIFVKGLFF
ncbi:manganese efflux pump MntP family protein [Treponema sp.]|uniref:manganese efflux pump MntP n=1 Tax=Treponema sp. TaxID=166 RepID=UPI00298E04A0|nr:manganese efflux pump [Treponema sp.]MCQ2240756.1 manganese efflux pump MntP family protein [Treponema sp.]